MAATMTVTRPPSPAAGGNVKRFVMTWTAHTDGAVDLTSTEIAEGELLRVVFTNGTVTPTNLYDVVIKDSHGIDVLAGQGANILTANPFHICPGVALKDGTTTSTRPIFLASALELVITNAGSGGQGVITFYLR